jgi:hypothetical protein
MYDIRANERVKNRYYSCIGIPTPLSYLRPILILYSNIRLSHPPLFCQPNSTPCQIWIVENILKGEHSELMRTNKPRRTRQEVNFIKLHGQVRHFRGGGGVGDGGGGEFAHNILIQWLHGQTALGETEIMGIRITWAVNCSKWFTAWTRCAPWVSNGTPLRYATWSFLNSSINVITLLTELRKRRVKIYVFPAC